MIHTSEQEAYALHGRGYEQLQNKLIQSCPFMSEVAL